MRRTLLLGLIACLTASSVGCMACGGWSCGPMGPVCTAGVECGPTGCGDCGGCNLCSSSCDACCEPCAAPCGDACCDPCGPCETGWGPLTPILGVLFHGCYWGCDSGCGEVWWGDFHGAPPACTDPCDCCGNWTGSSGWADPRGTAGCASGTCSTSGPGEISAASVVSHAPQATTSSQPVHYSLPAGAQFISESDRVVVPAETGSTAPAKPRVQAQAVSRASNPGQWTSRR